MRWFLAFFISLGLLGCDYYYEPNTITFWLWHTSKFTTSPQVLYRDSTLWLETGYEFSDSTDICDYYNCRLVSLVLIGKQQYLGKQYDTLDIFKVYGKLHIDTRYMFDNTYRLLGDSLVVQLGQTNGEDTMYTYTHYSVR